MEEEFFADGEYSQNMELVDMDEIVLKNPMNNCK
jgi:hypothetical protein